MPAGALRVRSGRTASVSSNMVPLRGIRLLHYRQIVEGYKQNVRGGGLGATLKGHPAAPKPPKHADCVSPV